VWLAGGQGHDLPPTPGDIWLPVSPIPVISNSWHTEMQRASRGPPWLLSAHDRQIYGAHHRWIEDFILCCGLVPAPPASSACPLSFRIRGIPVRRPTLLPPASFRCALRLTPLPLATLRLHQAGSGLCSGPVSQSRASPISSRALPGTHRDREEPHSSPLPHHAAYGSVLRGSADQAESDPGEHKPK